MKPNPSPCYPKGRQARIHRCSLCCTVEMIAKSVQKKSQNSSDMNKVPKAAVSQATERIEWLILQDRYKYWTQLKNLEHARQLICRVSVLDTNIFPSLSYVSNTLAGQISRLFNFYSYIFFGKMSISLKKKKMWKSNKRYGVNLFLSLRGRFNKDCTRNSIKSIYS